MSMDALHSFIKGLHCMVNVLKFQTLKTNILFANRKRKAFEILGHLLYSKTCVKRPLKNRQIKDLSDKWKLNEGQKYYRMLPLEHSAILLTCIKR